MKHVNLDDHLGILSSMVDSAGQNLTHPSVGDVYRNSDGTKTIVGNDVPSGMARWVGDATVPGRPTGITAVSRNAAVWVTWDGTLDGGIPADFSHIRVTLADGDGTVDLGELSGPGTVTAAGLTPGGVVSITALAYDDAHDSHGVSAPNVSERSVPVTLTVASAVDPGAVERAQADAQDALDQLGGVRNDLTVAQQAASDAVVAAKNADAKAVSARAVADGAKTTADGKNRVTSSATQPDASKTVPGDLWFKLDSSRNVVGILVWNGSAFVDYVLVAQQVLVAGSVGTISLSDGAVTADKVTASEALLDKLLVRRMTADDIDVGSLAAAVVRSGLFKTSGASDYTIMTDSGITVYKAGKAYTHLGSDVPTGLQLWNPFTASLTEASVMAFGAVSVVETNDLTTTPVGVAPGTNNWTPWTNFGVITANGRNREFVSPSGRFLVALTVGFNGSAAADFAYLMGNVNFRENNGAISTFNGYPATHSIPSGGFSAGIFNPTPFIGLVTVKPNTVYTVNFSLRSGHTNFGGGGINAYGHCNYRHFFIMPV